MNARRIPWPVLIVLVLAALACNLTEQASGPASATTLPATLPPGVTLPAGDTAIPLSLTPLPTATPPPGVTAIASPVPPTATPTVTLTGSSTPTPTTAVVAVACDAVIQQAIDQIDDICAGTGRNEACYGHAQVIASLRPGAVGTFQSPSDRIGLDALARLDTGPYNPDGNLWGIALLRLQADLPDALPGQALTLIAYGNTTVEDAGGDRPMQAVYINTGLGDSTCTAAPEPGVLIQNETGEVASLTVNGVDLLIGSTVLVQAQPNREMVLAVLEGQVDAVALGQRVNAAAGAQIRIALGAGLRLLEPLQPPRLELLDAARLQRQAVSSLLTVLPRRLTIPQPLPDLNFQLPPLVNPRLPLSVTLPPVNVLPNVVPVQPVLTLVPPALNVVPLRPTATWTPTSLPLNVIPVQPMASLVPPALNVAPLRPTATYTPTPLRFQPNLNLPGIRPLPTATPVSLR